MDKRIVGGGIILLLIGLIFLGLAWTKPITLDSTLRMTPVVGSMITGKLDITVIVTTPSWTVDVINTNTGTSVKNANIPTETSISFKGRLLGSDGQPIQTGYWVDLNLLASGLTPESGNQCWLGSAPTDSSGYFGTGNGYYVQPRSDGWYTTYSADGYSNGYVQVRNGAGNPGCQSWATTNPQGHTYSLYATVGPVYYSSVVSFTVLGPVNTCSGTVYINDVAVTTGASIRSPPAITVAFVPTSCASIQAVTLTGAPSGNVPMPITSEGKYVVSQNWPAGTYVVGVVVGFTNGGTTPVLRMTATLDSSQGSTQVMNIVKQLQNSWLLFATSICLLGTVIVGYGYKKHD